MSEEKYGTKCYSEKDGIPCRNKDCGDWECAHERSAQLDRSWAAHAKTCNTIGCCR